MMRWQSLMMMLAMLGSMYYTRYDEPNNSSYYSPVYVVIMPRARPSEVVTAPPVGTSALSI